MCGRLAPARTERKTISLICWLLNQNASLAPLFVKKAFNRAADVNSITNPDVTCHIDLKGLHEACGIYKYKLGVIGLIDSGRHSIASQGFFSLIFEDFISSACTNPSCGFHMSAPRNASGVKQAGPVQNLTEPSHGRSWLATLPHAHS